jgi:multisubunit Na+/H+ antiporter MnhB subunit
MKRAAFVYIPLKIQKGRRGASLSVSRFVVALVVGACVAAIAAIALKRF